MTAQSAAAWDVRHAFRLHRFELVGVTALVAVLAVAVVGLAGALEATGYATCGMFADQSAVDCEAISRRYYELMDPLGTFLRGLLQAVPFIAAILLGVPIIARELERGTGRLAWSLAPSRNRWFLARIVPVLAAVLVVGLVAGVALDRLAVAVSPGIDPYRSFDGFGTRGVVFAARVVFVFAIAVAAGALIGRSLPALLIAIVLASAGIVGGMVAHGKWLETEAVLVPDDGGVDLNGALYIDQRLRDPSGNVLTWDEAYALIPSDDGGEWPPPGWTFVSLVVPPGQAPVATVREVAALGLASLAFLGLAAMAVDRRRPG